MASPVWLDGTLAGQQIEVTADVIEQGIYRSGPDEIYTFALVEVFHRRVVVASAKNGVISFDTLFEALLTPVAQRAVQS
jgi:hypothetical protein